MMTTPPASILLENDRQVNLRKYGQGQRILMSRIGNAQLVS